MNRAKCNDDGKCHTNSTDMSVDKKEFPITYKCHTGIRNDYAHIEGDVSGEALEIPSESVRESSLPRDELDNAAGDRATELACLLCSAYHSKLPTLSLAYWK